MHKIEVSAGKATYTVDAYRHGKFAVHLPLGQRVTDDAPDASWVITHRATGLMVTCLWGRAAARRMARAMDAAAAEDITQADIDAKNDAWKTFGHAVAAIVKGAKE